MRERFETSLDSPGKFIESRCECAEKLKRDFDLDLPKTVLMWVTIGYFIIGIDLC